MVISANQSDLRGLIVYCLLAVIAQVFLLCVLNWNEVVIAVCVIVDFMLLLNGIADWLYFSRRIILDVYGCTFASIGATQVFPWRDIYIQYVDNVSFLFGDSEILGEGVILSAKPISKPTHIGAMTYCRYTHPSKSVFIRFGSPFDKAINSSAKFIYKGFVADKGEILTILNRKAGDGSLSLGD